jgi:AbiV
MNDARPEIPAPRRQFPQRQRRGTKSNRLIAPESRSQRNSLIFKRQSRPGILSSSATHAAMPPSGEAITSACTQPQSGLSACGMPEETEGLDEPLKTALMSIATNARSLLADAELLCEHGRYARAAALAVLAVEEVGKFNLLKGDKAEAQRAMRYHPPKQREVASFVMAEAAFDAYERTLHAMGLDWVAIEDVTPAGQKWIDSQGGWDKVCERLKSDTPILENMAEAFKTVSQSGLVRETLAGTLSRWKERGGLPDWPCTAAHWTVRPMFGLDSSSSSKHKMACT